MSTLRVLVNFSRSNLFDSPSHGPVSPEVISSPLGEKIGLVEVSPRPKMEALGSFFQHGPLLP